MACLTAEQLAWLESAWLGCSALDLSAARSAWLGLSALDLVGWRAPGLDWLDLDAALGLAALGLLECARLGWLESACLRLAWLGLARERLA